MREVRNVVYKTKLGEMEIPEEKVLRFEEGLPGFENLKRFSIVSNGSDPIMWLVSLEDDSVALPVINPWLVRIDYAVEIPEEVMENLGIEREEDVSLWAVLVIPQGDPSKMTINLMAPIVVNNKNGKAKQIILEGSGYDIRHSVKEELERSEKIAKNLEKAEARAG